MKKNALIVLIVILMAISGCKSKKDIDVTPGSTAKAVYNQAKKFIKRNPDKARSLFKDVMQLFPTSVYARLSKIGIADSYFKEKGAGTLIMASAEYQDYVNLYPQSPDAAYASYQVGMCYSRQMKKPGRDQTNTKNALKYFENMVRQFPDTKEAEEAKKKIEKARNYLASHYFRVGLANYRLKAYKGAISRFKQVIDEYPEFARNDKTFYFTGRTYFAMEEYDSAASFFRRIINSFPKSKYVKKSQKMIKKINKQKAAPAKGDKKK
ncbi:MAG: outer membrane protein assembly factor BamD [Candidatus Aminicenantes bacterium]|nr:outer membrane protein assembly factor BamD [Candidatus Aminicenantes bacterium]